MKMSYRYIMSKGTKRYHMCNMRVMCTWDAFMAQDPASKNKLRVLPSHGVISPTSITSGTPKRRYPEQGSICSQVISRKGSLLPSGEEYLRAGSRAV